MFFFFMGTKKDVPGNSVADLLGDCDPYFLGWLL